MEDMLSPPSVVKGMVQLNRDLFKKTVNVVSLVVSEGRVGDLRKRLKKHSFYMRNVKNIRTAQSGKRSILLDPKLYQDIGSARTAFEQDAGLSEVDDYEFAPCEVELRYDNWSAEEVLKSILPEQVPSVTGFSVVGHIAHLNLRDAHTPYKSIIGQVLLDKHKNLQSVVNKTDNIDNTYRNFAMELLMGKDEMNVTVKENGCSFQFDFSKVYWNSRLGTEHERIVTKTGPNAVVYDVFAGVGPFSVPAARRGATVLCNDLNPHSYESLCRNLKGNKTKGEYQTYNMDGREFIRQVIKPDIVSHLGDEKQLMVIMNLPAMAVEFLDAFVGLLGDENLPDTSRRPVMVHCYCFSKGVENYEQDVADRVNQALQMVENPVEAAQCRRVRNVAPNKEMMCAEFKLDWAVVSGDHNHIHEHSISDGQQNKRLKLEDS